METRKTMTERDHGSPQSLGSRSRGRGRGNRCDTTIDRYSIIPTTVPNCDGNGNSSGSSSDVGRSSSNSVVTTRSTTRRIVASCVFVAAVITVVYQTTWHTTRFLDDPSGSLGSVTTGSTTTYYDGDRDWEGKGADRHRDDPILDDHQLQPQESNMYNLSWTMKLSAPSSSHSRSSLSSSSSSKVYTKTKGKSSNIVHIIRTRFMQQQPSLVHLGMARLKLFEKFYLRSLQRQTSGAYISIIGTDPDLHPTVLNGLVSALNVSGIPHVLIATTADPKSYYDEIVLKGTFNGTSTQVLSGMSMNRVKEFLQGRRAQHSPPSRLPQQQEQQQGPPKVIETRLDADDGLHKDFVKTIQNDVSRKFDFDPMTWKIWCIGRHAEWQADLNFTKTNIQLDDATLADPGSFIIRPKQRFCVTPGMSIAYLGDQETVDASRGTAGHHKVFKQHKLCPTKNPKSRSNCIHFLPLDVAAVRARTPTSAGMLDVVVDGQVSNNMYKELVWKQTNDERQQSKIWNEQQEIFGFTRIDGQEINMFFYQNLKGVATDALEGQCTKGYPCKASSKVTLKKILAAIS